MLDLKFSVSLFATDLLRLADEIRSLEDAGCAELHLPIADGVFVPYFGFDSCYVEAIKAISSLPLHVHLMTAKPDACLDRLLAAAPDAVTLHVEAGGHIQRALNRIRETGAAPGVAIGPCAPLTRLDYLLAEVDRVVLCAAEPACPDGPVLASALERVQIMRENLDYRRLSAPIQVWGPLQSVQAARYARAGAASVAVALERVSGEYMEAGKRLAMYRESVEAEAPLA